jgi:hypothetical protein
MIVHFGAKKKTSNDSGRVDEVSVEGICAPLRCLSTLSRNTAPEIFSISNLSTAGRFVGFGKKDATRSGFPSVCMVPRIGNFESP